ncbi:MAG: hypothetical protein KGQ59_08650 [Bdellovibrionales bacterium]|nr:hypothetical protein [Bdellovibrionales bacterium]
MDHGFHDSLDRIRQRFSLSIPQLSPSPQIRRRLYGILLFLVSLMLGVHSGRSLQASAIQSWTEQNPPSLQIWSTVAQSRGLSPIRSRKDLNAWTRGMPRELSPHTAWWDEVHGGLWVIIPEGDVPEPVLFARSNRPTGTTRPPSHSLVPLGRGWRAIQAFQSLTLSSKAHPGLSKKWFPPADPKLWNF